MSDNAASEPATESVNALKFRVGNEYYCVDIHDISEVVQRDDEELRNIPNAPPHSLGVQTLYGDQLEVLKLDVAFDVDDSDRDDDPYIIVLEGDHTRDGHRVGWFVDEVFEIVEISTDDVETSFAEPGVNGTVPHSDDVVLWVDPAGLFEKDDTSYLEDVSADDADEYGA